MSGSATHPAKLTVSYMRCRWYVSIVSAEIKAVTINAMPTSRSAKENDLRLLRMTDL